MRYFIEISYDGKNYHGWQVQVQAPTVQEEINKALSVLIQEEVNVTGAGRTDAGVHALQMFAHFDAELPFPEESLIYKLNGILPHDVAVRNLFKMKPDAHARFDANARSYEYHIHQRKDPFVSDRSWYIYIDLNLDLMNKASSVLLEFDDFTSFSKVNTETKTNNCDISKAIWVKGKEQLVFQVTADRFLRNMVRALVGTLVDVGMEKIDIEDFKNIIKAEDRQKAGVSAPARGLFLSKIEYPEEIFEVGN